MAGNCAEEQISVKVREVDDMKHKLCLHGLEVKNQAQLLNLAKRLLPGSTVKVKIKEKYFNDNDMYKYLSLIHI